MSADHTNNGKNVACGWAGEGRNPAQDSGSKNFIVARMNMKECHVMDVLFIMRLEA